MENRISRNEAEMIAVYYIMSNCRAFVNDSDGKLSDLDSELISFLKRRADAPLPFFSSKKQTYVVRRDIARYSLKKFNDSFANKHFMIARTHLNEGVNSEIKLGSSDAIMKLAKENLDEVIQRLENTFAKDLHFEEQFLNKGQIDAFIEKGIMAGLVKN